MSWSCQPEEFIHFNRLFKIRVGRDYDDKLDNGTQIGYDTWCATDPEQRYKPVAQALFDTNRFGEFPSYDQLIKYGAINYANRYFRPKEPKEPYEAEAAPKERGWFAKNWWIVLTLLVVLVIALVLWKKMK